MSRGFSNLNVPEYLSGIDPSPRSAKTYLSGTLEQHLRLHKRSTEWWHLRPQDQRIEDAILGRPGKAPANALASNSSARYAVGQFGIDLFDQHRREWPQRRYALATLFSDRWLSFDRDLWVLLGGIKEASRQVIRLGQFDGWLAVVEFQTLVNTLGGLGRLILPNVHAVAWSDDPSFSFEAAEDRMLRSGRLFSHASAKTADVRRTADTSPTNLIAYMLKAAAVGKHRIPSTSSRWGFVLDDCALPPRAAARQTELLSSLYLDELIMAGGAGSPLRTALVGHLNANVVRSRNTELSVEGATRFWNGVRPRASARYSPVSVHRERRQLPHDAPLSLDPMRSIREMSWLHRRELVESLLREHAQGAVLRRGR
ncbi:hypothetical protein [Sphingomonas sp.]|jgi:hypothetical protein|uniref:hypothetical protein n=1 Tax=Sphingomonas sp. TaxID=28214 RepID=UPI002D80D312|nr:hypothetical protein [Sphingomonas sp.]HEU0043131.1 hypothetical protein [Sphingomonas sp.]